MLSIRSIVADDKELLFRWANDERVRRSAIHSEPIPWSNHEQWFDRKLDDIECRIYIILEQEHPVGQVRFDLNAESEVWIDYSIDREMRGQGLGRSLLRVAMERLCEDLPSVKAFVGEVKMENIASNKVFVGLGFNKIDEGPACAVYRLLVSQL